MEIFQNDTFISRLVLFHNVAFHDSGIVDIYVS